MALTYTCENQVIEMALEKLKESSLVAGDAFFNYEAPGNLRREVTYRDFDFLSRLSRIGEVETVHSILAWLQPCPSTAQRGAVEIIFIRPCAEKEW